MNCFNHPDTPAIGICKFCQKGLCKECAYDLSHGLACKIHIREVTNMVQPSTRVEPANYLLIFAWFAIIQAAIQAGTSFNSSSTTIFSLILAGVFFVANWYVKKKNKV